jgi:hypothetical protein
VILDQALGTYRSELTVHPGPEILQAHPWTLTPFDNATAA